MKRLAACLALALSMTCAAQAQNRADPVVTVTGGSVRGRLAADGAVFKAVPFAAPPVGELRWREPQPVKAWTGVRDAGAFSPSCVQEIRDWNRQEATGNQEDCLYLNVWNSEWPAKTKKPVMLWIFGGGNTAGGASVDYLDGASLARKGVVVVTINYRLGAFGFFAHPGLAAESPRHASGAYGLMDQIAALKWVQANIARFGGDPRNVTIFGQSAGGGNVASLIVSPLSKGLFHKAIQQSSGGGVRAVPTQAQAEEKGARFAATLGAPAGVAGIAYLRGLPAETVQKAAAAARGADAPNLQTAVDGWVLPMASREIFTAGRQAAVPLMIGSVAQEQGGPQTPDMRKFVADTFGVNADKALAYYGVTGEGAGRTDPLFGSASLQMAADTDQRCGSIQQAIWQSSKAPVFHYQFDPAIPGRPRPQHSGEVPYVFGNLLPGGFLGGPFGAEDARISDEIQTYWTNFAKTGDPNGGRLPTWPRFDAVQRKYLEFTRGGPIQNANLRGEICDLFRQNVALQISRTSPRTN